MYWDRFDIVGAYYLAFCHCHGGQRSKEYARLSKMYRYFKPGPLLDVGTLTENGLEIYNKVCEKLLRTKP